MKLQYFFRPAWAEVDIDAVKYNIKKLKNYIGKNVKFIAVVKGDAYGHGAVEIARQSISNGIDYFAVALVEEGIELRNSSINIPILVLGYVPDHQLKEIVVNDLTCTVYLMDTVKELSKIANNIGKIAKVHLKVNTGLNRLGLDPKEVVNFAHFTQSLKNVKITGTFTHLSSSAQVDKTIANKEFKIFQDTINDLKKADINPGLIHVASGAAILEMKNTYLDAVRPGGVLFGIPPYPQIRNKLSLKMALKLKCKIAQIREVRCGEKVGYSGEYQVKQRTVIATLPIGFTDGLSKSLGGKCYVLIVGEKKRVISICSDMCMVDLYSKEVNINVGEEVVFIGEQGGEVLDGYNLSLPLGVHVAEIMFKLGKRLPRVYLKEGIPYLVRISNGKFVNLIDNSGKNK